MPEEFATSTLCKTTQTKIDYCIKRVLGADPEPQKREGGGLLSASGEQIALCTQALGPQHLRQRESKNRPSQAGWRALLLSSGTCPCCSTTAPRTTP